MCFFVLVEILQKAVESVLADESFKLPSPLAANALLAAQKLAALFGTNQQLISEFAERLVSTLMPTFESKASSCKVRRENMWRKYHSIRTTPEYKALWEQFLLQTINSVVSPTFYQYTTDVVFRQLIQEQFPLPRSTEQGDPSAVISYQESNVLRYVSGYVCHALTARVKSSNHPQKKELLLCLGDLTTDEQDEQLSNTEDWTKLIDRGGLTHVNDNTYMLFHSMELEVRKHLKSSVTSTQKKQIVDSVCENDDVLFYWCMLAVESEDAVAEVLLRMLVELFVNLRGFAFTSTWMEQYKQTMKKGLQRSKALRREVCEKNE